MYTKETYQAIFETAPDALIISNDSGEIVDINEQVQTLFGYTKQELLGQPIQKLIPESFNSIYPSSESNRDGASDRKLIGSNGDIVARKKNGNIFFAEINISPLDVKEFKLTSAAIRDVSYKILTNQRLNKTLNTVKAKNKELEQFAYIASHDLQEPLRTVMSFVELFKEEFGEHVNEDAGKYLLFISQATKRMSDLLKSLLDYSRLGGSNKAVPVDCNEIISNIQSDLATTIDETNTTFCIKPLPSIVAYATELRVLFQNLITNAIKFRKKDDTPHIKILATQESGCWKFSVEDNGIGIDPRYKDRIFVIFQRLHGRNAYEGTGIGLAHCKKIVELHGGNIWLESELDKGSNFYFTISEELRDEQ